jgi:hypothetical protein
MLGRTWGDILLEINTFNNMAQEHYYKISLPKE